MSRRSRSCALGCLGRRSRGYLASTSDSEPQAHGSPSLRSVSWARRCFGLAFSGFRRAHRQKPWLHPTEVVVRLDSAGALGVGDVSVSPTSYTFLPWGGAFDPPQPGGCSPCQGLSEVFPWRGRNP